MYKKCPICGKENKLSNKSCEQCGQDLGESEANMNQPKKVDYRITRIVVNVVLVFLLGQLFVGSIWLMFFGGSLVEEDNTKAEGYKKTEGVLYNFVNCSTLDGSEKCNARYEYEVNGIKFYAITDVPSEKPFFTKKRTIKYNPENPSEYYIETVFSKLTFVIGIVLFAVVLAVFVLVNRAITKAQSRNNNTGLVN